MDAVIKELPLALFTTIASVGIGAFVAMFCAIYVNKSMGAGSLKRLDKLTAVPIVFCVVALICAFFHLGDPLHAVNIVNTIGSSPMTNEIVAFCVFLVLAVVYWLVALAGKLEKHGPRAVFSGVVALVGLVSCIMMGLAYALPAIPIWNSPWGTVQVLGAMLLGGTLLGGTILNMSVRETPLEGEADGRIRLLAMLGGLVLIIGTAVLFGMGASAKSAMIDVAANTGTLIIPLVLVIAFSIVAVATAFLGKDAKRTAWLACGTIIALVAIFLARGIFYGVQIGIGL
ncbi:MAG TPA: dimethyl sulfoxide reductase anchor subunit [Coriobacteriaceae bacterium]|nr:dimethyl sulfoxide reductase anchor subunit [Coriobacteriaceae bacterium]